MPKGPLGKRDPKVDVSLRIKLCAYSTGALTCTFENPPPETRHSARERVTLHESQFIRSKYSPPSIDSSANTNEANAAHHLGPIWPCKHDGVSLPFHACCLDYSKKEQLRMGRK
jgi:hypothetical protein